MKQTFKLKKGEILFDEDKIIIKDDAKKQKWMVSMLIFLPVIYAIKTFINTYQTGNQFDFWYGLLLGLLGILLLTMVLLKSSVRSEISRREVKSMKIKQRFGNKFLNINLNNNNNNRLRRVSGLDNAEELEQYINANFDTK